MTNEQKEELEDKFNYYSYLAEQNKRNLDDDDCAELYRKNISIMWALDEALKVLGYTFVYSHKEEYIGTKYWAYKLVKA